MKKILILGAGFLQSFIIKKTKELGYYTIAIDKNANSIGFKYADEYSAIDVVDKENCLKYAAEKCIDGVITAATDYGVISSAYVAKEMNLPGLDYEIAKIIKNKYLVRSILFHNKVDDVNQFYEIASEDDLENIKTKIHFPVIAKPCDGSGSKAVRKVDEFAFLKDACTEAIKSSIRGKALVEDFIEGREYGVESFVYEGNIHVLGVMGKLMTNPPDYAELGHSMPCNLTIEKKVKEAAIRAIRVLGINFGAVNMDVLVTKDSRVCIVDVGARMGGNLIGSHIIPYGTGIDYMGALIRASAGDKADLNVQRQKTNVATRLLALKPGKVIDLPDFEEISNRCNVEIYHHLNVGDTINEYHNNLDGCGYVLAASDDVVDAERRAEESKNLIDTGIVRE